MKEIGGYIELEHRSGKLLHEGAAAINIARNAVIYLAKTGKLKKLLLPDYLCESVEEAAESCHIPVRKYQIGSDFMPVDPQPKDDETVYLVNYYGRLTNEIIREYKEIYPNIIVDNVQAYFQEPVPGVDTIYTCRKFFGVPDGAFLYTDQRIDVLPVDISYDRMEYLLGRYEKTANEFYHVYAANEDRYIGADLKHMSNLTENLLRGLPYDEICRIREENYAYLHMQLCKWNELPEASPVGPFAYPFLVKNGSTLRKMLQQEKIYVATLWPNVLDLDKQLPAYRFASDLLPLPVDQRYGIDEMDRILGIIHRFMENET